MTEQSNFPTEEDAARAHFYLIFDEMDRVGVEEREFAAELDEIERVSRMAEDVAEKEPPLFISST